MENKDNEFNENNEVKGKKNGNSVLYIILILILIIIIGYLLYDKYMKRDKENTQSVLDNNQNIIESNVENKYNNVADNNDKKEDNLVKTEIYNTDLNHDNKTEKTIIKYYKDPEITSEYEYIMLNKIAVYVQDGNEIKSLEISGDELELIVYASVRSFVIDLDEKDNYSEIMLEGRYTDGSPQYVSNLFIQYDGKELSTMKVNYNDNNIHTYNYKLNQDKNIKYIRHGEYSQYVMNYKDGKIEVLSNSAKSEIYKLNDNHEFVLSECYFHNQDDLKRYTDFLNTWQSKYIVYEKQDLNFKKQELKSDYATNNIYQLDVIKVENQWIQVKFKSGEKGYIYIEDVTDYEK